MLGQVTRGVHGRGDVVKGHELIVDRQTLGTLAFKRDKVVHGGSLSL